MTRRAGLLLSLLAVAAAGQGQPRPTATVSAAGALSIRLPAELLRSKEVRKQLTSGLTTVFIVTISTADRYAVTKAAAKIDIRYELWEEKYLVTFLDPAGREQKRVFPTEAALAQWWSDNPLMMSEARTFSPPLDVQVTLKMLPFSSKEQSETQRWLSRALSASGAAKAEQTPARSAEVLRIIVETSIRRRPLLEYRWSVRATGEAAR